MQLLRDRSVRRPLVISVVLMYVQQLSGINAVFYFSSSFFKVSMRTVCPIVLCVYAPCSLFFAQAAGISSSGANYGTCLIGLVNVLATGIVFSLSSLPVCRLAWLSWLRPVTGVAVLFMERAGRRKLLLLGVAGMFFSAVLLTVCLLVKVWRNWCAGLGMHFVSHDCWCVSVSEQHESRPPSVGLPVYFLCHGVCCIL
jgi:MFS transporter, SP family, solute carrier family 2 (facilitated glucose transporter), member 1